MSLPRWESRPPTKHLPVNAFAIELIEKTDSRTANNQAIEFVKREQSHLAAPRPTRTDRDLRYGAVSSGSQVLSTARLLERSPFALPIASSVALCTSSALPRLLAKRTVSMRSSTIDSTSAASRETLLPPRASKRAINSRTSRLTPLNFFRHRKIVVA
jgi:hypothetical protein